MLPSRLGEGLGDAVHAADGLEHRRLEIEPLLEQHARPHIVVEQQVERHGSRMAPIWSAAPGSVA